MQKDINKKIKIVFFGTPEFSVKILEAMKKVGFLPVAVVTVPDKPKGRKLKLTPPPVKVWAEKNNIKVLQPESLREFELEADLFVVASYGKILPKRILDMPQKGTINVHPSLLPKLRGATPIQSAILLGEEKMGTTIMLMDEKMDEGPILAQQKLEFPISNFQFSKLEDELAKLSGKLLVETLPKWLNGEIEPQPQDHSKATYTKMISKKDGEIDWNESDEIIERKIRAFTPWPSAYTFVEGKRVIITKASLDNQGKLKIEKVKPEGKNEMDFDKLNIPIRP